MRQSVIKTFLCFGLGDLMHFKNENQDLLLCTTKSNILESFSFVIEDGGQLCHEHRSSGLIWTEQETHGMASSISWSMTVQSPVAQHVRRKESFLRQNFPALVSQRGTRAVSGGTGIPGTPVLLTAARTGSTWQVWQLTSPWSIRERRMWTHLELSKRMVLHGAGKLYNHPI